MNLSRAIPFPATLLICFASSVHADMAPIYQPQQLTAQADLIILGKQTSPTQITITKVVKGQWSQQTITIPGLKKLPTIFLPLFGDPSKLGRFELTGDVIVFLNLRHLPARVVANGVYRESTLPGALSVFTYWQPMNPGGYHHDPKPKFASLRQIVQIIKDERPRIKQTQDQLFKKIQSALKMEKRSMSRVVNT